MQILVYDNQNSLFGAFAICIGSNSFYQIRLEITSNFGATTSHYFDTSNINDPIDPVLEKMLDKHVGVGLWKYTPCSIDSIGLCDNYSGLQVKVDKFLKDNKEEIQNWNERLNRIP